MIKQTMQTISWIIIFRLFPRISLNLYTVWRYNDIPEKFKTRYKYSRINFACLFRSGYADILKEFNEIIIFHSIF